MAKAPSESRIPSFSSRIPTLGKLRCFSNLATRNKPDTQPSLLPPTSKAENKTIIIANKPPPKLTQPAVNLQATIVKPSSTTTFEIPTREDRNCTVTLDAGTAGATFVQSAPRQSSVVTANDVGKAVCIGNTQTGVLKYVGNVEFNAGSWCGVELDEPIGKHDGCVKGVRYFECRANCGIMAPISKVTVVDNKPKPCDNTFNLIPAARNDASGPYSLLEVSACTDSRVNFNDALHSNDSANSVIQKTQTEQDLVEQINPESVILSAAPKRRSFIDSKANFSSITSPNDTCFWSGVICSTPLTDPISKFKKMPAADTYVKIQPDITKTLELNKNVATPGHSPISTPGVIKQSSLEFDESLEILTPNQMVDFSLCTKTAKIPSSDDLKSFVFSKNNAPVESAAPVEDLSLLTPDQMKDFSVCTRSVKTPSTDDLKSLAFSKTSGLESGVPIEDSLSILTPDQMKDFSILNECSKPAFCDNLKSPTSSNCKTISNSRTPSSEELGSLPLDNFKQTLHQLEFAEQQNTTQIIRPHAFESKTEDSPCRSFKLSSSLQAEMSSPNAVESVNEFSLGLIEEDMLATGNQFSSLIDTTTNLELPLDSVSVDDKVRDFKSISRSDQTPSPEDLPLDPIDPIKPDELDILEPTLLIPSIDSDTKTDVSKSTTATKTNSFITSVTSITSLDTGYQGDGEMSRPASRGADHSPMAHKPNNPVLNLQWQRSIARRPDPMTDSDFFTESDADVHEENVTRGDRRAQVIDGTLYGINAQASGVAQDIFIGNQEEMDSSGVFTDLDNPRADDFSDGERNKMDVLNEDKSPSDISTKSISENSQELKEAGDLSCTLIPQNLNDATMIEMLDTSSVEKPKTPPQSALCNANNRKNARTRTPVPKDENPTKKFKMPNKNVPSKVKSMLESPRQAESENQENKKPTRKMVGRWDAVMSKISKGQEESKAKDRLKEVKSKVSTGISSGSTKRTDTRKCLAEDTAATKSKIRRARGECLAVNKSKPNSRTTSSVHSSISDLSVGTSSIAKQVPSHGVNRVAKKREVGVGRCTAPVTEVLIPGGHKPAPVTSTRTTTAARTIREIKKSATLSTAPGPDGKSPGGRLTPLRRNTAASVPAHKTSVAKDQSRITGVSPQKGGSPVRNQVLQEKTQAANFLPHVKHSAKGVEALGVLVQYLVFNLDAFRTPALKRELENIKSQWITDKLELEETRMGYRRLEDTVQEQKLLAAQNLEEERVKFRAEIAEIFEKQRRDVGELNEKNVQERLELERRLQEENSDLKCQLDAEISNRENEISLRIEAYVTEHKYRHQELQQENEKLRRDHQIALEILREENESIREQLDEKASMIEDLKELRFINEKLKKECADKERCIEDKLIVAHDEIALLKEENKKILETFKSDTKDNKLQAALGRCTQLQDEVESLRTVLDLKLAELSELRRAHGELSQAAEELPAALLRAQSLQARVEDLELQLERKTEIELQLTKENKRLQESFNQESKQNKRLSLHNEELQWKLKQNSEVVNAILQGQTPNRKSLHGSNQSLCDEFSLKAPTGGYLSRSHHTSSFNEKHHGTPHILERTLSFRERSSPFAKESPSRKSESPSDRFSAGGRSEYFELDDSPPSSPKVKGVVEKSDSVSWVLDMDESPEVIASRMVRRAGSFRNVTPPKSTPTKSPASKRPRTKSSNSLSLSASAGAIIGPGPEDKGAGAEGRTDGAYLSNSWHYSLRTSTPSRPGVEPIRAGTKLENNPDLEHESAVAMSLPALPSEIRRKKDAATATNKPDSLPSLPSGDLLLMQSAFPKNSAGEAMISESNSEEDDECSSSTSERSPSVSDTETSEEPTGSGDKCLEKHSNMQYDLFLLTESTTNSEAMDCSWSEELDV